MAHYFAVTDDGVWGIGTTPEIARASAEREGCTGLRIERASPAAYAHVEAHGYDVSKTGNGIYPVDGVWVASDDLPSKW
jgi:hypothetical protein